MLKAICFTLFLHSVMPFRHEKSAPLHLGLRNINYLTLSVYLESREPTYEIIVAEEADTVPRRPAWPEQRRPAVSLPAWTTGPPHAAATRVPNHKRKHKINSSRKVFSGVSNGSGQVNPIQLSLWSSSAVFLSISMISSHIAVSPSV